MPATPTKFAAPRATACHPGRPKSAREGSKPMRLARQLSLTTQTLTTKTLATKIVIPSGVREARNPSSLGSLSILNFQLSTLNFQPKSLTFDFG
jgi:hypothetical protein